LVPLLHEAALHQHAPEDLASRPSGGGTVTHVLKPMWARSSGQRNMTILVGREIS
jgi:hypothetical protein